MWKNTWEDSVGKLYHKAIAKWISNSLSNSAKWNKPLPSLQVGICVPILTCKHTIHYYLWEGDQLSVGGRGETDIDW